jgi:hypothetical protein
MKLVLTLLLVVSSLSSYARSLTTEQKLNDLNELVAMIKGGYGPLEYKKDKFGIDIDVLVKNYSEAITLTDNNSDFYYLIVKFVAEFNDSHFGARIPTTHKSTLGFGTDYINGRVLIDEIDRSALTEKEFPFSKGDEILEMNSKPTLEVLNELYPYTGQGAKVTSMRKAAQMFAQRHGSLSPVKSGDVVLKIRKGTSEFTENVTVKWILSGDHLDEYTKPTTKKALMRSIPNFDEISLFKDPAFEKSFRCSGNTRIKIPADATIIMKKPFVAYYHKTSKGNIGYLRIPHYSPSEPAGVNAYDLRFTQYEYAVNELEKNTVGLIIDQDHNCGGSVAYLHRILSLFAKEDFSPVMFELMANKQSFIDFNGWMKSVNQFTMEYADVKKISDLIKTTWLETENYLTSKIAISGKTEYKVNHIRYTKPIIVLIDENSGSGGDAFPAMMQGLGRAKLLGTRTMGAGGHVIKLPPLSNSQINVRMTKSLFYHPNKVAIENNGASPDIKYTPTRDDFVYEYRGYQKFYLEELYKLIK